MCTGGWSWTWKLKGCWSGSFYSRCQSLISEYPRQKIHHHRSLKSWEKYSTLQWPHSRQLLLVYLVDISYIVALTVPRHTGLRGVRLIRTSELCNYKKALSPCSQDPGPVNLRMMKTLEKNELAEAEQNHCWCSRHMSTCRFRHLALSQGRRVLLLTPGCSTMASSLHRPGPAWQPRPRSVVSLLCFRVAVAPAFRLWLCASYQRDSGCEVADHLSWP